MKAEQIKEFVKSRYARVAQRNISCCGSGKSCCGGSTAEDISRKVGYGIEDLASVPEGANLGLGCGNPVALASLREGDIVVDLGSGAGFDAFLAAARVGKSGKVFGIDMTPEMIQKANANAAKGGVDNVEFKLGEIENLPIADNLIDIIISNCVINLSPDKGKVFREAIRVLKPGGRIMVSDIVLLKPLPEAVRQSVEAYAGCIAGAAMKDEYLAFIEAAGFQEVSVVGEDFFQADQAIGDLLASGAFSDAALSEFARDVSYSIASIKVSAKKPE
ncbi:MAG: arsenite methyltransferase [Desulfobacteraceae bacterium]|nr:arsenite methyltransferase [Desulfobacteraceae bacterium]